MPPMGCVAAAADNHTCYAMLARRSGETVLELLERLDKAIATAAETNTTIDEVPGGHPISPTCGHFKFLHLTSRR